MNTQIFVLLLCIFLFPGYSFAETYFCVSEAGASVKNGENGIESNLNDVSDEKFIQTNESGEWVVKLFGKDDVLFDKCVSPYFCEASTNYYGVFIRPQNDKDGVFYITLAKSNNGKSKSEMYLVVESGRCSKL